MSPTSLKRTYPSDLTPAQYELIRSFIPAPKPGGRPCSIDRLAIINAIFYVLRTGCQWRLLPHDFPAWGTVHYYFRRWRLEGVWVRIERALYRQTRQRAGKSAEPHVAIMDSQTVKTTEKGGARAMMLTKRSKAASGISSSIV